MAVPIKPSIATKTDYAPRPSIPSSQKQNATEFNLIVSAIRANYERVILNWDTDIVINTTLPVGQYVLYSGSIYIITTAYSVGSPLTWNGANAAAIGSAGASPFRGSWAGTTALPVDADNIGSDTDGDILAGDYWIFTNQVVFGGSVFPPKSVAMAIQNSPTTLAHWTILAPQS